MLNSDRSQIIFSSLISLLLMGGFSYWARVDSESLTIMCKEDGIIENLTAGFLLLSSISFIIFAKRSTLLRNHKNRSIYFFIVSWILLMFIFAGEEISWGQRIFNFATPEGLSEINKQNEFNVHNIAIVDSFAGGQYRYLSIFMLITGLLLPAFALSKVGKQTIQKFAFPVCQWHYSILMTGAYIWGKLHYPSLDWVAPEVRELLMAIAMFCFATHGAMVPCTLFRTCKK